MDFTYSQQREAGGTLHLPSPTHGHNYHDSFSSINKIRRSLSRSPSKAGLPVSGTKSPHASPRSPLSPLALSRAFSPSPTPAGQSTTSLLPPVSPLAEQPPPNTKKSKFVLRRSSGLRSSPRISAPLRSPPRRALSETFNQGNITPSASHRTSQEENNSKGSVVQSHAKTPFSRPNLNDEPIKFDFIRSKPDLLMPGGEPDVLVRSSPLKRSDEVFSVDRGSSGSPVAKRRSIHSAIFSAEFDIFAQMNMDGSSERDTFPNPFASPMTKKSTDSPLRKTMSLRKSTLHQRQAIGNSRPRMQVEETNDGSCPSSPFAQPDKRMSLDSSLFNMEPPSSPFLRSSNSPANATTNLPQRPALQRSTGAAHPHPLSNAIVPSSSASSFADEMRVDDSASALSQQTQDGRPKFSRSLPIGSSRPPTTNNSQQTDSSSFATPDAYKIARPHPAAFMSTGLISKRNRNVSFSANAGSESYAMPDTPSKRVSFPPMTATPGPKSVVRRPARPQLEFGSPSTPFVSHTQKPTTIDFGKSPNLFAAPLRTQSLNRKASFASIEGDDNPQSPSGKAESQSSADELPPTPTKQASTTLKQKESSLRSSLFGRRTSIQADTFVAPAASEPSAPRLVRKGKFLLTSLPENEDKNEEETPPDAPRKRVNVYNSSRRRLRSSSAQVTDQENHRYEFRHPRRASSIPLTTSTQMRVSVNEPLPRTVTPTNPPDNAGRTSPQTPQTSFTPPEGSFFSVPAGPRNNASMSFNSSTSFNQSFPPATPTAPRDHVFPYGNAGQHIVGVPYNDVDTSLTARFGVVAIHGIGEFSHVYRVEKPLYSALSQASPLSPGNAAVWAVKKTKKPYTGTKDRERKLREVDILRTLRGNDHIINFIDFWESKGHLYIQTEFCEDGNLKDFLAKTGFKGRLDDFRIWKILLELTLGIKHIHDSGFIHLDLKPANVFIDFEGVLKIGDFGLAIPWPADPYVDGEGDREYIAPEVLSGRFDKPADIFALGMIMLEIAGNIVLPDNGSSWQRLRHGDMSDLPSLTFSSEGSLPRDASGDPLPPALGIPTSENFLGSDHPHHSIDLLRQATAHARRSTELVDPPKFMIDPTDSQALEQVVAWMISQSPAQRPTIEQVSQLQGVQWVETRRRSGATIYEGNWGPSDDIILHGQDVDMTDV